MIVAKLLKHILPKETEIVKSHFKRFGINSSVDYFWSRFFCKVIQSITFSVEGPKEIKDCFMVSYHAAYLPSLLRWLRSLNLMPNLVVRSPRYMSLKLLYKIVGRVYRVNLVHRFNIQKILVSPISIFFIDQDTKAKGAYVPFFNIPAKTPITVFKLATQLKKPVFFVFYKQFGEKIQIQVTEIKPDTPQNMASEYNLLLENVILQDPFSWSWFHKRWKSRGNKLLNHEEYIDFLLSSRL